MSWLFKQSRSQFWYIGDYIDGKAKSWSTKKKDKKEAEKVRAIWDSMQAAKKASRLTDGFYEALSGKQIVNVSLSNAVTQWLRECKGSVSKTTHERYKQVGKELVEHLNSTDTRPLVKDVTRQDVFGYLSECRERLSANTTNLMLTIIRVFFGWCISNNLLASNPAESIKPFKAGRNETVSRRTYTLEELKKIYGKAPDDFWRYMILGGFYTGYRMGDLICLQVKQVDLEDDMIRLETGKTGKLVQVPLAAPFRAVIVPLAKGKSHDDYLWPKQAALYLRRGADPFSWAFREDILVKCGLAPKRMHWRQRKKIKGPIKASISPLVFHCLRHSFVTAIKKYSGAHQSVARALTGHTNDRQNEGYTHVDDSWKREAIKKLPDWVRFVNLRS